MGKVRKLRKKYNALCSKIKTPTETQPLKSEKNDDDVINFESEFDFESLSRSMNNLDNGSIYSVSKSIKSAVSGMSIQKKEKRKLRHELFLKKLNASKEVLTKLKKTKRKEKKLDLKDDLPLLRTHINTEKNSKEWIPKHLKVDMKKRNSQKGLTKRRNAQLMLVSSLYDRFGSRNRDYLHYIKRISDICKSYLEQQRNKKLP